ncbi:DUF6263 family protein [Dinghuibacter silviterrae]|uniref:Lipoprotein n=1 Tax=Dinghuibacter silviterrae TaxID=1539049 RepID=A0A4R8DU64_9BACT|nr:DUF6263 family protein [Dinghuibacter silviterrae]TDX01894.1 hypothetical protein EDB95_2938 [Dinghuibacter silviterrae]
MDFGRLFPAFCLALVCWSCTPSSWFAPAFRPQPGAVYHYTVSELTHALTTERGQRVNRDEHVRLAFHYRLASPGTLTVGFDAFSFHEKGEKREKNVELTPDFPDARCVLGSDGRVNALTGLGVAQDQGYVAGLLEKGWGHFPTNHIKVGDSWTALDSLNADPHISVPTTYTLIKVRDGVLYIKAEADVHLAGEGLKGASHPGLLTLVGRQHGMLHVDAATGLLLDGQTVLQAQGALKTGGGNIPLHIESTCSVSAA